MTAQGVINESVVIEVNGETGDVDLSAADVGADPAGSVTTHVAASDPHGDRAFATNAIAAALLAANPRVVDEGEYVLDRGDVITASPSLTGTLYVTHFTAAVTETIQTIRTGTGGSGSVAVGSEHAWIGVLRWDGTNYVPEVVSVDDPTRWTAEFATYDTQLWAWDHAGEPGFEGFDKVAGQDYAEFRLWIGSGQPPSLAAGGGWYQDSLVPPRTNGQLFNQTQPPAAPLPGAFFGPDSRRFQALLSREEP